MRRLVIAVSLLITLYGCGAGSSGNVATADKSKGSTAAQNYERSNEAASRAFDDLDCMLDDSCVSSSTPAPAPTGNAAYDRQQSAADNAFKELDCEIAGGTNCSVGGVVEKPKPVEEKAPEKEIENKPRPGSVIAEKPLERGVSKYPLVNGYPIWFAQPGYDGYLGGVGIAKPQNGGYAAQKRVATALAQADLARSVKVNVYNEFESERTLVSSGVRQHYQEKYSTMSRQDVDSFVSNAQIMDEWIDNRTGELYVWVVLPK